MEKIHEVCIMAAAGMMGSTFDEESFYHALSYNPDMIGCDSGTSDSGPYYLGAGVPRMNRTATKHDLTLMITEGLRRDIPVLIGSAGTAGADPNVDWMIGIVREIAQENNFHFKLAEIKTEISVEQLLEYNRVGKLLALEGGRDLNESQLQQVSRCVSVIGPEPYIKTLNDGAQVIIAGRSTDVSIFTAVPIREGLDDAFAWHAAKVLECGSLASVFEIRHGSMLAWIRDDSASIQPGHADMSASPVSVVSHTLYENANPYVHTEPGREVYMRDSVYSAENNRKVKIFNTTMIKTPYTVKVEGTKFEGYRRAAVGSIMDPLIIRQFPSWIAETMDVAKEKIKRGMGLNPEAYLLRYLVYGDPGNTKGQPLGVMFDVLAATPEQADGLITNVWHTALHVPIKDWQGAQSQMAFPFSPPTLQTQNGGETYSFCLNHVIVLDDPLETSRIAYYDL